jgi:branched-chain amino acid transport system substrate-binding protein
MNLAQQGKVVLACALMIMCACGSGSSGGGAKSLKIGFEGPLTGGVAVIGVPMSNAVALAVEQAKSSLSSQNINLAYEPGDDQVDPAQAPAVARKLIQDKQVVAVVGPIFGSTTNAAGPLYTEAHMAMLTPSASAAALTTKGWTFFRMIPNDDLQGTNVANYMAKVLRVKKAAIIDDATQYGRGIATVAEQTLSSLNVSVVDKEAIDPKSDDFSGTISKIIASGADATFLGASFQTDAAFNRQLRDKGYKGAFFAPDGALSPDYIKQAGPGSEGTIFTCQCAPVPAYGGPASGPLADFIRAYKAKYNADPQAYTPEAYDAANMLIAAIKAGKTDRQAIVDWLKSATFTGVTKSYSFQPNGELKGTGMNFYQVKNGQINWIGSSSDLIH